MSYSTKGTFPDGLKYEDLPDILTLKEVAGLLRVSPMTIKRKCMRGLIPHIIINDRGDRRFKKSSIINLMDSLYEKTIKP